MIERLIAVGQRADRAWVAKWAEVAGDPDYLTAFQKKIADPEGARDRFSQQEIEAVRRVNDLAEEDRRPRGAPDRFSEQEIEAVRHMNEVDELRAMSTVDTLGGYLIPAQLDPAILLSSSGSQNAIREMARVEQSVGETWRGVAITGATVRWVAEASEANDDSPPLAQPEVPAYRGDCFVPYSVEIEGDGAGFVTEIGRVMLDAIQRKTNDGYAVGSGVGMPTGFVSALAGTSSTVDSAGTDVLVSSDVYNLRSYRSCQHVSRTIRSGPLIFHLECVATVQTTAGALKFPSVQNTPPTLLGRPANVVSNMDRR